MLAHKLFVVMDESNPAMTATHAAGTALPLLVFLLAYMVGWSKAATAGTESDGRWFRHVIASALMRPGRRLMTRRRLRYQWRCTSSAPLAWNCCGAMRPCRPTPPCSRSSKRRAVCVAAGLPRTCSSSSMQSPQSRWDSTKATNANGRSRAASSADRRSARGRKYQLALSPSGRSLPVRVQ